MRRQVQDDWDFADRLEPQIAAILQPALSQVFEICRAADEEDRTRATDYIARSADQTVACRVRRPCKFRDLTLRYSRPTGVETEVAKIRRGEPRWYLYVWTTPRG